MPESPVKELREFPRVGGRRTVLEPAGRIEGYAGLGSIGYDETDIRIFRKGDIAVKITVRIYASGNHVYHLEGIYRSPLVYSLEIEMIKPVLAVEDIDHPLVDRLHHHYAGIEVCSLVGLQMP